MKIHEIHDTDLGDESHEVWIDLEEPHLTGLCIGTGNSAAQALRDARGELERVIVELNARLSAVESA